MMRIDARNRGKRVLRRFIIVFPHLLSRMAGHEKKGVNKLNDARNSSSVHKNVNKVSRYERCSFFFLFK